MIVPVILSGGAGTRLWPLSRKLYPKQFLQLIDHSSLFQATLSRLEGLADVAGPLVVCNDAHRFLVAEQLREAGVDPMGILLEPIGRNTAPAAAVAALHIRGIMADAVMLLLPADHVIRDEKTFHDAVARGLTAAREGALVTFGIPPTAPETGYGYIKVEKGETAEDAWPVERFVEKPDSATAREYLDSGAYYWNSGMFLFRVDAYLEELGRHRPDILEASREALEGAGTDLDFVRLDRQALAACPEDSIDYAVMEHTDRARMVPMDAGWNDVGSWSALLDIGAHDGDGNVVSGDVLTHNTRNSYIHAEDRLIATVGLENHVVVETADAVLVAARDQVQDVKQIVEQLRAQGREECNIHSRVYRPWGSYEGITASDRYQVKHIVVNPGERLSLQMHHHRAEHWVVVSGTAKVSCDGKEFLLSEDQSTYIPLGTTHRLENPGVIPLELIEVQSGAYLGEDDIVRFDDHYGRHKE